MKKSPEAPLSRWWDWTAVILLILLLQIAASRLIATEWTEDLGLIRGFTWMGSAIGLSLGYDTARRRSAKPKAKHQHRQKPTDASAEATPLIPPRTHGPGLYHGC